MLLHGGVQIAADSKYGQPLAPKRVTPAGVASYAEMFPGATRIKQAF